MQFGESNDRMPHRARADGSRGGTVNPAFVLLGAPALPSMKDVIARYREVGPAGALSVGAVDPVVGPAPGRAGLELRVGDVGKLTVVLSAKAVPKREADDAARSSLSRFKGDWKLPPHGAHLLVIFDTAQAAAEALAQFTALVAAVSEAAHAVGIYLGSVPATHEPRFFSAVTRMHTLSSRLMLWAGVDIVEAEPGRVRLLSVGMKRFGLLDALVTAPRAELDAALPALFDLLAQEMSLGRTIADGELVVAATDLQLVARHVASPTEWATLVWRVDLP